MRPQSKDKNKNISLKQKTMRRAKHDKKMFGSALSLVSSSRK